MGLVRPRSRGSSFVLPVKRPFGLLCGLLDLDLEAELLQAP